MNRIPRSGKSNDACENIKANIAEFVCLSVSEFTNSSAFALMFEPFDFPAGALFFVTFFCAGKRK